jgi:hypothetical protein
MASVRQKLQQIAEMYDDDGYGGVLLGAGEDEYGGVLLGAAKQKKKGGIAVGAGLSQYSEFVKKYRKGNQFTMAEIAQMWKDKKLHGGVNVGGATKKVMRGSKTMKKSVKPKGNIQSCLNKLKIAKENDIKLTAKEKAKIFRNHGCSYVQYKKAKGKLSKGMSKADLKKKLLQKPKMK